MVSASAQIDGLPFAGESSPAAPVPGGITDVGDLELMAVSPECPCTEPSSWDGAVLWQLFLDFLPDFVDDATCIDTPNLTALELSDSGSSVFGASVDAAAAACHAFLSLSSDDLFELTLVIHPSQVASCREFLRSAAQSEGLPCDS